MPSNSNDDERSTETETTGTGTTETGTTTEEDDRTGPGTDDDRPEEPPGATLSRRNALLGAGLGLGLFRGQREAPPGREGRPWNRDVDAGGNDLRNLGGLNTTEMPEEAVISEFGGSNLEIDDARLRVADRFGVQRVETNGLAGGVTGGEDVEQLVGDGLAIVDGRLTATCRWRRTDGLLEPSDEAVDGIEVEEVESSDDEDLTVESSGDLVVSVSGGEGAVRIETEGGHEIVLDDEDGAESVSVEDSAGNRVEMDATTDEVSISANAKITLDAPTIDVSAGGTLNVESRGITTIDGALVKLGPGGTPAASVGDAVVDGTISTGSPIVLI